MYVDDLSVVVKYPNSLMDALENMYKFKLKGMGPIEFHLGCDFFCDRNGVLCFSSHKYIDNMVQIYMTMFGYNQKLKKAVRYPLEQGGHLDI